jgi:hypothetical protein
MIDLQNKIKKLIIKISSVIKTRIIIDPIFGYKVDKDGS